MKPTEPRSLDEITTAAWRLVEGGTTPFSIARDMEKLIREAHARGKADQRQSILDALRQIETTSSYDYDVVAQQHNINIANRQR